MDTTRLTVAQAIVRFLITQRTVIDEREGPLFPGVFAIFGHGNVTALGDALEAAGDALPTWRGQNEQTMAMAAAIAHADRLPLLVLSGDTFVSRLNDPALQQVENFGNPTTTVNDAFRPVTRYWDRITSPEQILQSLPQDVQARAFEYPAAFFEPRVHQVRRPGPDPVEVEAAGSLLRSARSPLVVAGGGVHYSLAEDELARFAEDHGLPVVETVAGKSSLTWDHPSFAGPIGVTGSSSANALAGDADVVLAVGTRLQDFTTGSW